jgi:hypothetical protein
VTYDGYRAILAEQARLPPSEWTFKRIPGYQQILEHVTPTWGHAYLAAMQADFPDDWRLYKQNFVESALHNDSLGNPECVEFPEIGLLCSPTNLRYMHQALCIEQHIAEMGLARVHAIEIGGGYGGLAWFLRRAFAWRWLEYTIIDLPEAGAIQRAYAQDLGFSITTVDCTDADAISDAVNRHAPTTRFLISAYGFSEFTEDIRAMYERLIVQHVPHGWLVWNMIPIYYFTSVAMTVSPERPETARGNLLVRF